MITSSSLPSLPPYPCSFPLLLLTYPPTYPFSLLPTGLQNSFGGAEKSRMIELLVYV